MKIKKLGHSCLILEAKGERILIDPGNYTFLENPKVSDEMQNLSAVFITHEHLDHIDIEKFLQIPGINAVPVYTNKSAAKLFTGTSIQVQVVLPPAPIQIGEITVRVFYCPHGILPDGVITPLNIGLLFDDMLFYSGDSVSFAGQNEIRTKVLALPIAAPWLALKDAIEFANKIQPDCIIPVHDAILKYPDLFHGMVKKSLDNLNLQFKPLKAGEMFEIEL